MRRLAGRLRRLFPKPSARGDGSRPLPAAETASLEFVLIAESGRLERQALLLCESLRRFAGRYAACPVTVVSPRPGRRPSAGTIARLESLGCAYRALDVRSVEPAYGTTFRMLVSAELEASSTADVLVVMDSDLLFCAEPDLALQDAALAARPVDTIGICSTGPDDPRDAYWQALCGTAGVSYDAIPTVRTTFEGTAVKASYNGGLVAVARRHGVFRRTLDYFEKAAAAGLSPSRGTTVTIRAGHGDVSGRGAELWGSSQACLSLAVWGSGLSVRELPRSHNFPLNFFDSMTESQRGEPIVVAHYHTLLDEDPARNPMLNGEANIPPAVVAWLRDSMAGQAAGMEL